MNEIQNISVISSLNDNKSPNKSSPVNVNDGRVDHEQEAMPKLTLTTEQNGNDSDHINHSSKDNNHVGCTLHSNVALMPSLVNQALQNQIIRYFENFQAYETTIVEKLDEKCQQVLMAEGCPVCLRSELLQELSAPAHAKANMENKEMKISSFNDDTVKIDDDKEQECFNDHKINRTNGITNKNENWVVIKCKLLSCQHVMHLSCAPNVSNITLKPFHCSSFFRTFTPRTEDDDFVVSPRDPFVRNISIRFRVIHLLSDKSSEATLDLTCVPKQWHQKLAWRGKKKTNNKLI